MKESGSHPAIASQLQAAQNSAFLEIQFEDGEIRKIYANPSETILEALHRCSLPLASPCGGNGSCKGCLVKLTEKNHQNGGSQQQVLACQETIGSGKRIQLPNEWKEMGQTVVLTQKHRSQRQSLRDSIAGNKEEDRIQENRLTEAKTHQKELGVAVDIGTTTIGFALLDVQSGNLLAEYGCMNAQRIHGSDVMARIRYGSSKSGLEELQQMILTDIYKGIQEMHRPLSEIRLLVIAANTTMLHLLRGQNPASLGSYPFTPVDADGGRFTGEQVFGKGELGQSMVWIPPCASAFIGADLTAGAAYLSMGTGEDIDLLVDLGTNGEMILGNRHKMLGTSAAAGPAFESCLHSQGVKGAKMLDYLADSLRRGFLNQEGLIGRRNFESGIPCTEHVVLDQPMVRSIQLAKAAIHAGIVILMREYGIGPQDIRSVYLAGGFGFHLHVENAIYLGLLPKALKNKIKIAGNTSLLGAAACLHNPGICNRTKEIAQRIQSIDLANTKEFASTFLEKMEFRGS